MMLSGVSTGFMGSKYTRLLKQGEAGHTVAIVEVSWIERPCGSSSRCIRLRTPPYFGVSARAGKEDPVTTTTTSATTSRGHLLMSNSSPVSRNAANLPLHRSRREPLHHVTLEDHSEKHGRERRQEAGGGDDGVVDVGLAHHACDDRRERGAAGLGVEHLGDDELIPAEHEGEGTAGHQPRPR